MGDQEYDITPMVSHMTKYAEMITDAKMVKYHVDKALYLATHGRPGPVWLDIPLDVQGASIDSESFVEFNPLANTEENPPLITKERMKYILTLIKNSQRPVLMLGNGIHISNCFNLAHNVIKKLNLPVAVAFNSTDLMAWDDPLYVGQPGLLGDRPGNWAIQNADLILSIGCRLSRRQVGYDVTTWARAAHVIMVDIDKYELLKPSVHVETAVHADAKQFLEVLYDLIKDEPLKSKNEWIIKCQEWKKNIQLFKRNIFWIMGQLMHMRFCIC